MSYGPNQMYPGATEIDPNYPKDKFKDNNPSTTNNGTPLKAIKENQDLTLETAVMNDAGFEYNGIADTPQDSQLFKAYKASLGNGANLLSNHNFLIQTPDDSQPLPDATPRSYPPGYQIFSGVFANETTGITNLTYIDGRVSFSGGDLYFAVPNTGAIARLTSDQLTASVADFDGKPRTRGVSFALVGDEYRVTVGIDALEDVSAVLTPLGSVKFEQGAIATGHSVENYKNIAAFEDVSSMISRSSVGLICSVDNFLFERVSSSSDDINDFDLISVGGLSSTPKYNKIAVAIKSLAVDEWYVNQATGQDAIGAGYDISTPAKTIQFVIDSMPDMLSARYTQKVNLSAGTFNESSRPASEMARPAIVWPNDKFISNRTTQASGAVTGALVIEGQGVGVSVIQTNPDLGYLYGVYASGCEIALYNLSVLADESVGVADSSSLVVSHRGAYVHGKDIHVGSASAQLGLVCEAGGWAEMISSSIKDCGGTDVVVYQDSSASLAGADSDIGHITNNGFLQLAENCTVNGEQLHTPGSQCQVTSSQASTKVVVNGSISGRGSQLNAAFGDFNGPISCEMSGVRMSTCAYQEQITMFGGDLLLSGTDSYTGLNTENSSLTPVVIRDNASFKTDAASEIKNSNGDVIGPDYGNLQVNVNSDGFAIPVSVTGREIDIEIIGAGSNRTGATLPSVSPIGPYGDAQVLRLTGAGFNVQIVEGSTANIPGGSITVGGLAGGYSGVTFIYSSRTGEWNLQGVSLQN